MKRRNVLRGAGATATVALAGAGSGLVAGDCCCGSDCSVDDCCPLCADCGQQVR